MPAPTATTSALLDELQSKIWDLWPELQASPAVGQVRGVWIGDHVEGVPFDKIDPPYAVVAVPEWGSGEWSPDVVTWEQPVHIYYVNSTEDVSGAETPGQDASGLRNKLKQLVDYMLPQGAVDPLQYGQVLSVSGVSTSRALPFNQILKGKKLPLLAGRVIFQILVEE